MATVIHTSPCISALSGSFISEFRIISLISVFKVPEWIPKPLLYIYIGFTMWLYSTFDAIDGKHARNTEQNTPLGAFFDHGCDACAILFQGFISSFLMREQHRSESNASAGIAVSWYFALSFFWFAQWTQYHTGERRIDMSIDMSIDINTLCTQVLN
jgi:phosphatidylglycerophosphate synthase